MLNTYYIDSDNCLSVEFEAVGPVEGDTTFTSQQELADATKDWPASRLVEV